MPTTIVKEDILPLEEFLKIRPKKAQEILDHKKNRCVHVGNYVSFYFESYETIWWQIHEMLRIEKGGDEQIRDEIQAYAPLIPKTFPDGSKELVATMMIEIEDIPLRHKMLTLLQGIEKHIILRFGPFSIAATWEKDVERTRDGKTSSVHFMKFFLKDQESKTFDEKNMDVILEITHPHYTHKTVLSDLTRHNLASK